MWNRVPYGFSWEISTHAWKNLQQICLWKINTSTWNNLVREKNTPAWKNLLRGCAYKLPQFPGLISPGLPLVRTITWLCNLIVLTAYILKYKSYKVCFQPFDKKMPSYQINFETNCSPSKSLNCWKRARCVTFVATKPGCILTVTSVILHFQLLSLWGSTRKGEVSL